MYRYIYTIFVLILLNTNFAEAQFFGKNKVQYRNFDWAFIQSPHFDIYFYTGGKALAEFTSKVSEDAYNQISKHLNWDIRKRVSIIIYNSHNDFQQTNVTYEYMPEGVGGVTELFKNRVVIPFEGSYEQFRHVIHHELVHAVINDMVYGGSAQSLIQNRIRVRIPLWMNEGLAEYLSIQWDTEADMIMRDVAVHDRIPEVRELNYYMAYKGGQSVWRFIVEKYGWEKVGEIFAQAKIHQDVTKAFQKALGMDFKDLSKQWQRNLKKEYWPDVAGREELEDFANRLTDHEKLKNYFNISPQISPDGSKIALISDRSGYSDIYLISAIDGKEIKRLIKGNRTPDFEELKLLQPGITWSPDSKQIAVATKAGKSDAIYLINVKNGKRKKLTFDLDGIFTAAWSPEGDRIAFVGNKDHASDIYLYNLKTKTLKNLTEDIFYDSEPSWSPDGRNLVFISNRGEQNQVSEDFTIFDHDYHKKDIYILDTETGDIKQITNTPYTEKFPLWSHTTNSLAYTSDRNGVWNLYIFDMDSGQSRAISNALTGIIQLSWSSDDQKLIFSGYSGIGYDIYSLSNPLELPEQEVLPSNFILWEEEKAAEELAISSDSTEVGHLGLEQDEDHYSRYIFAPEYAHYNQEVMDSLKLQSTEPLTSEDYQNPDGSYRTHPYQTRFTLDLVSGQAGFSNVFGYQGSTLFAFSDILGDHRIFLGTELVIDLESSDYFFLYEYLKHRNGYAFSMYHTADFIRPTYYHSIRLRHYSLDFSLSRPFSRFQRMEFGFTHNYINYRVFELIGYNEYDVIDSLDKSLSLPTYRLNWIYDNSSFGFTGPNDGWRANLQYMQSIGLYGQRVDFQTILFDGRKYFRLSQLYSFALRFSTGYSFGRNAQKFLLGGVSNWIIGVGETNGEKDRSRFSYEEFDIFDPGNPDYLENLYFSIFSLPVRGHRFIERVGTKMILSNFEFRFPFINYLALGFPLRLILGNILGVLFIDAGAAWDDKPQFTSRDPITGKREFDNMIVGYGIGIRLNLGYTILKLDTAWDYMMTGSSKPQYYISLGTDL